VCYTRTNIYRDSGWTCLLIALFCLASTAQQSTTAAPVQPTAPQPRQQQPPSGRPQSPTASSTKITNAQVIRMVKAGVPESAIVSSIQSSRGEFDLSADGLLALHRAGVNQKILETMIASQGAQSRPATATTTSVTADGGAVARTGVAATELKPRPNLAAAKPRAQLRNQHAAQAGAAIIAVLQKQRSIADAEAAQMRAAIPAQAPVGLLTRQPKPMSAAAASQTPLPIVQSPSAVVTKNGLKPGLTAQPQKNRAAAASTPATQKAVAVGTVGLEQTTSAPSNSAMLASQTQLVGKSGPSSPLLSGGPGSSSPSQAGSDSGLLLPRTGTSKPPVNPPSSMTHPIMANSTALVCTNNPQFRILTVSGSQSTVTFTPIDQYNLYTITGCSFGNPDSKDKVYLYGANNLNVDFLIQFWSDNSIAVCLNPGLAGLPDLNKLTLVVQRGDGQQAQKGGFSFYAARQTVQLSAIPSSWVTLAALGSGSTYGNKTMDAQYSSPPTSSPGPGAGTAYVSRSFNGAKFDPTGQNPDFYNFTHLAPGFTTDSMQLITYPQNCPYVVTYKQDFGTWHAYWGTDNPNNIYIFLSDTTCSGVLPPTPWINYQNSTGSYYALKVWVNGPLGIDPITGQP